MNKVYLFDYGGTLDSCATHWYYLFAESWNRRFKHSLGHELSDEKLREAYVFAERALEREPLITPRDTFLEVLKKKLALQADALEKSGEVQFPTPVSKKLTAEDMAQELDDRTRQCILLSEEALVQLKNRGHRFFLVSNFYGNLRTVIRAYGIDYLFDDVIESAVVGIRKPSPEIFTLGVKAAGVKPEDCVVVGDSIKNDIIPGRAAGCHTVWYRGKQWDASAQPDESLADFVIPHLSRLASPDWEETLQKSILEREQRNA
ncbi:MAG: HAD family hydrolase [Alloprevotella sp.]